MPTEIQRYLTIDFITKRRLNAPTVWLKPEIFRRRRRRRDQAA